MLLVELIPAIIFGVLIGNYTTTCLFRIPRGIDICGINEKHSQPPCCSTCRHPLKFYEFLPVLSWIFARFKCNYCNTKINHNYFILEFSNACVSVILYLFLGYSEIYLLFVLLFAVSMLSGFLHLENNFLYIKLTITSLVLGMLYRTLSDSSIIPFLTDFSVISIVLISALKSDKVYNSAYRNELTYIALQLSIWSGLNPIPYIIILAVYIISVKKFFNYRYLNSMMMFYFCTLYHFIN
jgi:leader peptidase (prepilin peptidase)/N-methyltransferase